MSDHDHDQRKQGMHAAFREQAERERKRSLVLLEGEAALRRLFNIASGTSHQCRYVASFLLGCYNGQRFPCDLNELRSLDADLVEDCIAVLRMDSNPEQEVHRYFENGGEKFERLARDWNIAERS